MKKYNDPNYLPHNKELKTYRILAKENKVSTSTIYRNLIKLGYKSKKKQPWSDKEIKDLKENYNKNFEIHKIFPNRSKLSVFHKANKLGLKRENRERKYYVNHDFFNEWSNEMSYILGWSFSDGSINQNLNQISLHLSFKDINILKKISKVLENTRPISLHKNSANLRIQSKTLALNLKNLGCIPKKSLILKFPEIPEKYLLSFIRGYFDGDGCITFNKPNTIKISFIGSKNFILPLQNFLYEKFDLKKNKVNSVSSHICTIYYYGDCARKLCNLMYSSTKGLYLKRKRDKFKNHIEIRKNGI